MGGHLGHTPPTPESDQNIFEWRREAPLRPVVFAPPTGFDGDVVQMHLSHRVVQRLLGRFMSQGFVYHDLSRACLAQSDDAIPRVVLLGRLSLYGAGAARLHEELITVTARWTDPADRKGALSPYGRDADARTITILQESLKTAGNARAVPAVATQRLQASMAQDIRELLPHLELRGQATRADAEKMLAERGRIESAALRLTLEDQRRRVLGKYESTESSQLLLGFSDEEKRQLTSDQPEGLVVSAPALVDAQAVIDRAQLGDLQHRFAGHVADLPLADSDTAATSAGVTELPLFFTEFLGWQPDFVLGWDPAHPLPESLAVSLHEFHETLRPTYAVTNPQPKEGGLPWLLLVQSHPATVDLDKPAASSERGWHASPAKKFERLLRETQVPIGLLTNGTEFRLIYAPPKENSGALTFPIGAMTEISGRLILGAFHLLLNSWTLFNAPSDARLPSLLQRSRDYQASVSEKLAEQVLHALYELLRGFEAADERAKGALLRSLAAQHPEQIYGGLVTVLLRLVFVLFAEDRGLLPMGGLYVNHYAVRGLFERLRADAERYPDTMDHRFGAWAQLLALFRLIHGGCQHHELKMPAREGHLFDPDRYPFLEGRSQRANPIGALPLVSDGVLHRILEKLCILDGERVSYRTLDVEEIGSVYQTIMGFGVEVVAGTAVALKGKRKKGSVPAAPIVDLEALLAQPPADRLKHLGEQTDTKLTGETEKRVKDAATVDDLLAALDKRMDRNATPSPIAKGGLAVQPNDERRRSGSHYSPRSFTEPIVRKTL